MKNNQCDFGRISFEKRLLKQAFPYYWSIVISTGVMVEVISLLCHILWHCEIKEKKKKNSWICIDRYVCVVYLFGTWRFHHNFVRGEPKSYTTGFNIKCKLLLFRWCNTSGRQYPAKIVHVCFSCRHTSWQSMTFFKSIEETFIRLRKMHELL